MGRPLKWERGSRRLVVPCAPALVAEINIGRRLLRVDAASGKRRQMDLGEFVRHSLEFFCRALKAGDLERSDFLELGLRESEVREVRTWTE